MENNIKIYYRIIEIDKENNSFVVRYWTDIITEDSLATHFDAVGDIARTSDGYPVRCQSDINVPLGTNFNPTREDILYSIEKGAPSEWFLLKEKLMLANNQPNLDVVESMLHEKNEFNYTIDKDSPTDPSKDPLSYFNEIFVKLYKEFPNKDMTITFTNSASANTLPTIKIESI
jgi:hypothetical protein